MKKMPVTFKVGSTNSVVAMRATCETAVCQKASALTTAIAILVVDVLFPSKALILLCVCHTGYVAQLAIIRGIGSVNWDVRFT